MIKPQDSPTAAIWYPRVSRTGKRTIEKLRKHTLKEQRELSVNFLPRSVEFIDDERFHDLNVSGRRKERAGLEAAFEAIENGEANAIVVGYLSRFGRNTSDLLANLKRLHALGATLYVAREGLILAPGLRGTTKMLVTVLAAVAEMEADRLEETLTMANETAVESGVSIQVPYGYMRENGPGSRLTPDERDDLGLAPAEIVRMIFAWRADGKGASEIARTLNEMGVITPTAYEHARGDRENPGADVWRHNTVRGIITTHTYKGVIPRATAFVDVENKRGGKPRRRAVAWEYLPAEHQALVTEEEWKAAQPNGEPAIRNGKQGGSLLQGLVRCASCSRTMRPTSNKGALTYSCKTPDCPRRTSIGPRAAVEEVVWNELLEGRTESVEQMRADRATLDLLREELAALEAEMDEYVTLSSAMKPERYLRGYRSREAAINAKEAEVSKLSRRLGAGDPAVLTDIRNKPIEEQRVVLTALLDAVVIKPPTRERGTKGMDSSRIVLVGKGHGPESLSASGRIVPIAPWPLEMD